MNPALTQQLKPWPQAAMIGLCLTLVAGCKTSSKPTPLMAQTKRAEVTREEINYQLFDFVARYSRQIEFAADRVAGATDSSKIQRQALLWKLHAVPAAFLAIEHQDPVAVLVDLWALCAQQTAYFNTGARCGDEWSPRAPAPASAVVDRPTGGAGDVREWGDPSP